MLKQTKKIIQPKIYGVIMSEKSLNEKTKSLDVWENFNAPKKVTAKSKKGKSFPCSEQVNKLLESPKGCSVSEATKLHYGENYNEDDSDQAYYVRNKILRPLWKAIQDGQIQVAIPNAGDKRYYKVPIEKKDFVVDALRKQNHDVQVGGKGN